MFEGPVLGVDPGLAATGLAAVIRSGSGIDVDWADTVRTPADLPEPLRLRHIYRAVRAAIDERGISVLAVERVMWGRNVGSAMVVARATGVVLLAAADAGIPVEEYAPLEVKMAVAGAGNAPKERVRRALGRAHGLKDVPTQPDAADAVAVAVCHLQQARLRRAARVAVP
jgi:crossover junction endodeoxyribonuclease RuvC